MADRVTIDFPINGIANAVAKSLVVQEAVREEVERHFKEMGYEERRQIFIDAIAKAIEKFSLGDLAVLKRYLMREDKNEKKERRT